MNCRAQKDIVDYQMGSLASLSFGNDKRHIVPIFLCSPYPVCRWWWDVDDQRPRQLLYLHSEQQGCVGHLLKLLPDKLVLRRPLEILGFSYFVHKSQNLLSGPPAPGAAGED